MTFFVRRNSNNNSSNNENRNSMDSSRWALEEIKSSFVLMNIMGEGSFGTVRKVRSRHRISKTGVGGFFKRPSTRACKTIPRSKVGDMNVLKEECANLESVRGHPHLLEFVQTFEDSNEVHIITELLEGGELYEAILRLQTHRSYFRDDDAAWMIRNILDGLSYCHDVTGIVHRDLKASNFMFKHKTNISAKNKQGTSKSLREIKIIDYGLSTTIDPETGKVEGRMGTPYYVAPEVLTEDSYDSKCDVWSIGVIAYLVLSKTLPFQGKDESETIHMLMDADNHQPKYDSARWMAVEPEAVSFCKWLLTTNLAERPTARKAMAHPWIVKHCGPPPKQRARINPIHSIAVVNDKPDQKQQQPSSIPEISISVSSDSSDSLQRTSSSYSQDFEQSPNVSVAPSKVRVLLDSIPEFASSLKQQRAHKHTRGKKSTRQRRWFSVSDRQHAVKNTDKKTRIRQKTQNTLIMNEE
uniref:Protein kinase domain-containing protein n=1 Tax=Pseudo-nitzschia australis TaxID=44445 RepID=A0A7S4ADY4_9STRA|mmetsp:Transcript_7044/g.15010  ORF Transcript_7044/g.15010 Transcript_7044/m.15010 type:complete len:468 (-) Transcript_7044:375-1778(-)|eukprot:CAMPEP_0168199942 /NCGR_PEP_ID=MMETSP0139_2-20121125/22750_1 /TAXON_ID=44445 /ORGANISM="Pseudo-nitzschia australis, Strain 10249 10 AB" /LENGTH=467 /DNA_ID=CAMNT_0008125081 /DNA_START=344 /DNA_END=1747 /DNA_ORIENTATION=-